MRVSPRPATRDPRDNALCTSLVRVQAGALIKISFVNLLYGVRSVPRWSCFVSSYGIQNMHCYVFPLSIFYNTQDQTDPT